MRNRKMIECGVSLNFASTSPMGWAARGAQPRGKAPTRKVGVTGTGTPVARHRSPGGISRHGGTGGESTRSSSNGLVDCRGGVGSVSNHGMGGHWS